MKRVLLLLLLINYTDNVVWKAVCSVLTIVLLGGTVYMSVVVIQLMLQHMRNPVQYEEGRCVERCIHHSQARRRPRGSIGPDPL